MADSGSPPPLTAAGAKPAGERRDRAWTVIILNQLALPGFGTVLAGRKIGYLQLGLSVSGVVCLSAFLFFAVPHLGELMGQALHPTDDPDVLIEFLRRWTPWLLVAVTGVFLFGVAWLWALPTSARSLKAGAKNGVPRRR